MFGCQYFEILSVFHSHFQNHYSSHDSLASNLKILTTLKHMIPLIVFSLENVTHMKLDHTHFPLPCPTRPLSSFMSSLFTYNTEKWLAAAHVCMCMRPSTDAWEIYLWPHIQKNVSPPSPTIINHQWFLSKGRLVS